MSALVRVARCRRCHAADFVRRRMTQVRVGRRLQSCTLLVGLTQPQHTPDARHMTIAARDWLALSRLLDTALSLPPGERESWLQGLSGNDAALKPLLHDLISRKDLVETHGFLDTLPKFTQAQDTSGAAPADAAAGERVGPYRL